MECIYVGIKKKSGEIEVEIFIYMKLYKFEFDDWLELYREFYNN